MGEILDRKEYILVMKYGFSSYVGLLRLNNA